jgi:CheY-like chemotaxis protein
MPSRTILLVEDDPNDEHLTLRALRQSGVPNTVVVAHTAEEALDFLHRSGPFNGRTSSDPIVIFVDNTLPGFPGSDLVSVIRTIPSCHHVPIVVFSGNADLGVVERCALAGANSFLEKPIEMADYIHLVGNAARYWLDLNLGPHSVQNQAATI